MSAGASGRLARLAVCRAFAAARAEARVAETEHGVSLVAARDLPRNSRVVSTPFVSWAMRSAAFALASGPSEFLAAFGERTTRETVALAMSLLNERRNGESDAYARTLPDSFHFTDVCLNETRVDAMFRGTETAARMKSRGAFIRSLADATRLPVEDVSWAIGAVSSHAMKNDVVPYALVPGCDLLDHSSAANCDVRRDAGSSPEIYCATTRDVVAGEKLTISYGSSLNNDRAFRMYGFASPELYANDSRGVDIDGFATRFRGVHPSAPDDAFERSVRELENHRQKALDAWTADAETFSRRVVDDACAETLRRGQAEIIDAYVSALR